MTFSIDMSQIILTSEILKPLTGQFSEEIVFVLNARNRGLRSIEKSVLKKTINLVWADFTGNQLAQVDAFCGIKTLEALILDKNRISCLPRDNLSDLPKLKRLSVKQNPITQIDDILPGLTACGSKSINPPLKNINFSVFVENL